MKKISTLLLLLICYSAVKAQSVGIKTNALYWATSTINLGVEVALAPKITMELGGVYNPFEFHDNRKIKGWGVQPELRWWTCSKFAGHFFGIHGQFAEYNAGLEKYRYDGNVVGMGLSYGYDWVIGKRWNLEATVGLGYNYMVYNRYGRTKCGNFVDKQYKNYWGPTKLGLSFIYLFR